MWSRGAPSAVSYDDSGMKISVRPPQLLEESSQGLRGVFLCPSPPAQVEPGLPPRQYFPAPERHITPLALFADVSPSLLLHPHASVPRFNPLWPVLVPPGIFSSASVAHHTLFRPVFMSQPGPISSRAPGAGPDPFLRLFPAPQMIWASVEGCEPARLFSCTPSDARALTRCFLSAAPAQDWTSTSDSGHQRRYTTNTFTEMPEQDRNRGHRPQRCSGEVKKDLPESALDEYCQIMDALGAKVTEGSEVTDEEEEFMQYINKLLDDSQSMTESALDMDYITSLLTTDVLKDDPEAVAGCSAWTCSPGSEAPPADAQRDSRPFKGTDLLLTEDPILAPFQDTVKDQTVSQMFTDPEGQRFQTDQNTSVQDTLHPDLQDFKTSRL